MMRDDHGGGSGWGSRLLMTLPMLAIFALFGWRLFLAFGSARRSAPPNGQASPTRNAEAILVERLALPSLLPTSTVRRGVGNPCMDPWVVLDSRCAGGSENPVIASRAPGTWWCPPSRLPRPASPPYGVSANAP